MYLLKSFDSNIYVIILLYVDDMLIFGTSMEVVNMTKSFLASNFNMIDMGEANMILVIKIIKSDNGFILLRKH